MCDCVCRHIFWERKHFGAFRSCRNSAEPLWPIPSQQKIAFGLIRKEIVGLRARLHLLPVNLCLSKSAFPLAVDHQLTDIEV